MAKVAGMGIIFHYLLTKRELMEYNRAEMAIRNKQGKEVVKALAASGMSQGELSRRLGVSPSYTSRVVNGTRRFGIKHLRNLSAVLGIPVEALIP